MYTCVRTIYACVHNIDYNTSYVYSCMRCTKTRLRRLTRKDKISTCAVDKGGSGGEGRREGERSEGYCVVSVTV